LLCPLICGLAALLSVTLAPGSAATLTAPALADTVPSLRGVRDLGRAPQALPVSIAVTLAYRHDTELEPLIAVQSDPTSPAYHRFLSNAQFAAYFGPTPAAYAAVGAALTRAGFHITATYANDSVIDAVAPAAVVERYFSTEIHRVLQADAGERYANVTPATLPTELRGAVSAVTGLTNVVYARPAYVPATPAQKLAAQARALAVFGGNAAATTTNEVHDPGFESGTFGDWQSCSQVSSNDPAIVKGVAHSGSYSAFAGSRSATSGEISGDAGVCQGVTIPTSGVLTFWVKQSSNEPNTTAAFQEAALLSAAGKRIVTLYSTVSTTNGWKQLSFNLSKYAGGRYLLYFGVHGNGNKTHETQQYVDDVSLTGSAYAAGGTSIGGPLFGPDSGYGPAVVADAYDLPVQHGYDGAGRATAVEICGDYSDNDLKSYLDYFGITRGAATTRVEVAGGATYSPGSACSVEATLDVETIVGLAPSTQLYLYVFPDLSQAHIEDGYNRAVSDDIVDVVNSSFSGCEIGNHAFGTAIDLIAAQGAVKGITFAAATGDSGSTCSGSGVDVRASSSTTGVGLPASAPYFVGVGGTSLHVNGNGSYKSEVAWGGSTGGYSIYYVQPAWQLGFAGMKAGHRNVPDIAFVADPATGTAFYYAGAWRGPVGGTSWGSPIYSALQTEVDQRHGERFGHANPAIYAAAAKYTSAILHDVTSGCNGAYCAHAGYDNVTGLGSLNGYAFSGDE
jgi:subtilase family serine protease